MSGICVCTWVCTYVCVCVCVCVCMCRLIDGLEHSMMSFNGSGSGENSFSSAIDGAVLLLGCTHTHTYIRIHVSTHNYTHTQPTCPHTSTNTYIHVYTPPHTCILRFESPHQNFDKIVGAQLEGVYMSIDPLNKYTHICTLLVHMHTHECTQTHAHPIPHAIQRPWRYAYVLMGRHECKRILMRLKAKQYVCVWERAVQTHFHSHAHIHTHNIHTYICMYIGVQVGIHSSSVLEGYSA